MTTAIVFERKSLALIASATAMLLVDAITLLFPALGYLGMSLHLANIAILMCAALHAFYSIIRMSIRFKSGFTLLVLGIWIALIGFWAQDSRSLSGETTQETTCAIVHLENSQDKGLHQTCLFGYPARQYLPQGLASLIIGRSLVVMNLAGSVYFLIGILLFCQAIIVVLGNNQRADIITAILIASLFHFRFVNHFLFHFEQSIFPLSFALMLAGLGLQIINRQSTSLNWGLLGSVVLLAIHSYTPSLVLLGLVIPISCVFCIKQKRQSFFALWLVAISAVSLMISLTYRQDLNFASSSQRTSKELLRDVAQAHAHLLMGNQGEPLISPVMHGVAIAFALSVMLGIHGKKVAFIGWWAYGVVLAAVISKGYSYYSIDFRLHRSLVIIPPLLVCGICAIKPFRDKFAKKYLIGLFAFIFATGVNYSFTQISQRPISSHYGIISQLKFFEQNKSQTVIVTENAAQSENLVSLHDAAQYFLPSISVRNMSQEEIDYNDCARVSDSTNLLLVLASDAKCLHSLSFGKAFKIDSPHFQESYVVWKP